MKIYQYQLSFHSCVVPPLQKMLESAVFFDIETTGLHWKTSHLTIIGMICKEQEQWKLTQIFLESPLEEQDMLLLFVKELKGKQTLIHFNGNSFDLPYITRKCEFYQIDHPLSHMESFDLYRQLSYLKKIFAMDSLKQKDVERLVSFSRQDQLSGKEVAGFYQDYLKTGDKRNLDLILLHNREDMAGMTAILPLLNLHYEIRSGCHGTVLAETTDGIQLKSEDHWLFPKNFEFSNENYRLGYHDHHLEVHAAKLNGTLKHFFSNPKDYYYLPGEDLAIHKSVGQYVDKDHRQRATAATCYQKKKGTFLPAPEFFDQLPVFFREYKDPQQYVLFDQRFREPSVCGEYLLAVLKDFIT